MRLVSREGRKKLYYIGILLIISISMYLGIKYVLPVALPILIAFLIALGICRIIGFMNRKLHINSKLAALIVILVVVAAMVGILMWLYGTVVKQVKVFAQNVDSIVIVVEELVQDACNTVGRAVGADGDEMYRVIEVKFGAAVKNAGDNILNKILNNTTGIAKETVDIIVLTVFVFTVIIYMAKNMRKIQKSLKNSYFAKEITYAKDLFKQVFLSYLKAQFIIMLVVASICTVGLLILQNPYSLSIGIFIGIVDALPLLGTCIVLLPWTVVMVLQGEYFYGAMLFTMFVLSYMAREYLEPKIMGKGVGIDPVWSLIAIYVGYTLFGFLGMIIGPFALAIIMRIMNTVRIKLENS